MPLSLILSIKSHATYRAGELARRVVNASVSFEVMLQFIALPALFALVLSALFVNYFERWEFGAVFVVNDTMHIESVFVQLFLGVKSNEREQTTVSIADEGPVVLCNVIVSLFLVLEALIVVYAMHTGALVQVRPIIVLKSRSLTSSECVPFNNILKYAAHPNEK